MYLCGCINFTCVCALVLCLCTFVFVCDTTLFVCVCVCGELSACAMNICVRVRSCISVTTVSPTWVWFSAGWCDNIVITGSSTAADTGGSSDSARFVLTDDILRIVNPLASIVHAHDGRVVTQAAFDAILADDAFQDHRKQRIRALRGLDHPRPNDHHAWVWPSASLEPAIVCHVLHFTVPLHRAHMSRVVAALGASSQTRGVLRIKGRVLLDDGRDGTEQGTAAATPTRDAPTPTWHVVNYTRGRPTLFTSRLDKWVTDFFKSTHTKMRNTEPK